MKAVIAASLLLCPLISGCSTSDPAKASTRAKPLRAKEPSQVDLSQDRTTTATPFSTANARNTDASVGVRFADTIALRLRTDCGALFEEVRTGKPQGGSEELVVGGAIHKYNPGSKFGRAMLAGVGTARFEGELVLRDGGSDRALLASRLTSSGLGADFWA